MFNFYFSVNRLKEETGVVINIDESGLIRIEGNRDGVNRARAELEERVHKLENEKERDVIIEQRHYRNIIGTKGDKIKTIRDMFNQVIYYEYIEHILFYIFGKFM